MEKNLTRNSNLCAKSIKMCSKHNLPKTNQLLCQKISTVSKERQFEKKKLHNKFNWKVLQIFGSTIESR